MLGTHHLEELPTSTTHTLLLAPGRASAAGPADEVLTTEAVSRCFDHPVHVERRHGRWRASAAPADTCGAASPSVQLGLSAGALDSRHCTLGETSTTDRGPAT